MEEQKLLDRLYTGDSMPENVYKPPRKGNWLVNLAGYIGIGLGSLGFLFGSSDAYAGTKFYKFRGEKTGKETHARIDYPDRVVGEGECAITTESEEGLWTTAVAVSAPDDRADITDAKCLRKIKLTKIGEALFDPRQEGVWRDANKKSYGTLGLNVGNAKFALKALEAADRAFRQVYGERFAKDFPPELFAEGMEATTLWMRRESGDLLNVPYYGSKYIVKLRFHGKEEGEEIPVYVSVWPFNINEKFLVKFEGTPVAEKPKEKLREKPAEKPRREEAPPRRGAKPKLSDLARVDADSWIYPDEVDKNRDGSWKYGFGDPEQVVLAVIEGVNNNVPKLYSKFFDEDILKPRETYPASKLYHRSFQTLVGSKVKRYSTLRQGFPKHPLEKDINFDLLLEFPNSHCEWAQGLLEKTDGVWKFTRFDLEIDSEPTPPHKVDVFLYWSLASRIEDKKDFLRWCQTKGFKWCRNGRLLNEAQYDAWIRTFSENHIVHPLFDPWYVNKEERDELGEISALRKLFSKYKSEMTGQGEN